MLKKKKQFGEISFGCEPTLYCAEQYLNVTVLNEISMSVGMLHSDIFLRTTTSGRHSRMDGPLNTSLNLSNQLYFS